jgi:hypothetical protein
MKNIFTLLFIAWIALPFNLSAQHIGNWCGTSLEHQDMTMERLRTNKKNAHYFATDRSGVTNVAVRFTLVAENNGSNRASSEKACLEALCILNEDYADQDIVFYLREFEYMNNTAVYEAPSSAAGYSAVKGFLTTPGNNRYNALNIFVTKDASNDSNGGITLAYYMPEVATPFGIDRNDYIVCDQSYLLTTGVISHEVGHFFSLAHTFKGWEPDLNYWAGDNDGDNIINYLDNVTVGNFALDTDYKNENQDQSNCDDNNVADEICDTPPDYGFGFLSNNCTYAGNVKDPKGQAVSPQENNYMGYYRNCSFTFTNDQKSVMAADLGSTYRNYIRPSSITPNTTVITETPNLTQPADASTTPAYNTVLFQWDPVPNASQYLLEIDRIPSFSFEPTRIILSANGIWMSDIFESDRKYYWRVTPFNNGYTCVEDSQTWEFTTGTTVSNLEITKLNSWTVSPNPVRSNSSINMAFDATDSFIATLSIYSTTGQIVHQSANHLVPVGSSTISLPLSDLQSGIYFVQLQSESGISSQRLVITE